MVLISRECENCGATVEKGAVRCAYCGTWFEERESVDSVRTRSKTNAFIRSITNLPPQAGEFGLTSKWFLVVGLIGAFVLYILGWLFEDPQYWLDERAVCIWMFVLPAWLLGLAFLWRTSLKVVFHGLGFAGVIFGLHIFVIWLIEGRLWDDHIGIATLIAGAAFLGWLVGRFFHLLLRKRRAGKNNL